ncbi:Rv3235 family protein [Prescottella defluvii]|uniref:Rv3235 family protein n=1 Tax=Prescottella defluvii TaxID=1323361 RepID=UPI0004F2EA28|nr:Rv3235 family protein [Prescottella defluvii]
MTTPHRFLSRAPQCEPPASEAPGYSACPPAPRPSALRAPTRSPHDGRSSRRTPATPPDSGASPDARRFAESALRLTLEVLDRRRTPAQLRPIVTPTVLDLVNALTRSTPAGSRLGTAALARVRVQPVHVNASDVFEVFEVFGTYNRGSRVFAVAARIERGNGRHPAGWAITSLRIA